MDQWAKGVREKGLHVPEYEIRWVHDTHPERIVAVQKLAHYAGLAYLCPESYLSIHPLYGPWFAYRAVVLFRSNYLHLDPPTEIMHPCPRAEKKMKEATQAALRERGWRDWLHVREVCPLGQLYRYSEDQILYHYTKNHRILCPIR